MGCDTARADRKTYLLCSIVGESVRHDFRRLERWGVVYYGCCEPLDRKIPLLRRIPNLRKFSMSPWNNFAKVIDEVQGDYVLSFKPLDLLEHGPEMSRAALKDVLPGTAYAPCPWARA